MKSEFCLDALIVFSYTNRNIYTKVIEIGSEIHFRLIVLSTEVKIFVLYMLLFFPIHNILHLVPLTFSVTHISLNRRCQRLFMDMHCVHAHFRFCSVIKLNVINIQQ